MRLRYGSLLAIACLAAVAATSASPALNPSKEADIRRLIKLTGTGTMGAEMGRSLIEQVQPALESTLPPGERSRRIVRTFAEKVGKRFDSKTLTEMVVPIYDKHLTHQEVLDLIEFYQTPLGKRLLEVMPGIMEESQTAGRRWSEKIFREVVQEMETEFPELKEIQ